MIKLDEDFQAMSVTVAKIAKTQQKHGEKINRLLSDVGVLKRDVAGVKTDVADLKTDVGVLKTDVADLKTDVGVLKTDMIDVKSLLGVIISRLPER
jgi:archaellum component FlaC